MLIKWFPLSLLYFNPFIHKKKKKKSSTPFFPFWKWKTQDSLKSSSNPRNSKIRRYIVVVKSIKQVYYIYIVVKAYISEGAVYTGTPTMQQQPAASPTSSVKVGVVDTRHSASKHRQGVCFPLFFSLFFSFFSPTDVSWWGLSFANCVLPMDFSLLLPVWGCERASPQALGLFFVENG